MSAALLLGAGFGLGLLTLLRGLFPPRPSLAAELQQRPDGSAAARSLGRTGSGRLVGPLGALLLRLVAGLGLHLTSTRRDLAVTGHPLERHLAEKVGLALFGLLLSPASAAALAAVGVRLPLVVPVWAAAGLAVGGFVLPDIGLRADANALRRQFRHTLSLTLDLTVIALAGGAGVEGALTDATMSAGQGIAGMRLRQTLEDAHLRREPPWTALGRLGEELGVPELVELAASVGLAGTEGARVRPSLAAKAASLRTHELTDTEAAAQAATERMSLPVVLLFAAFLLFIGFPAVARVVSGL
jgi:tight adherence protein C